MAEGGAEGTAHAYVLHLTLHGNTCRARPASSRSYVALRNVCQGPPIFRLAALGPFVPPDWPRGSSPAAIISNDRARSPPGPFGTRSKGQRPSFPRQFLGSRGWCFFASAGTATAATTWSQSRARTCTLGDIPHSFAQQSRPPSSAEAKPQDF